MTVPLPAGDPLHPAPDIVWIQLTAEKHLARAAHLLEEMAQLLESAGVLDNLLEAAETHEEEPRQ